MNVAADPLAAPRWFTDTAADAELGRVTGFADRAALTAELEALAFRGWPALRTEAVGGWVLRDSGGVTRRGNSVWARGDVADLTGALAAVERFYARAGRPSIFQLTPVSRPDRLADALDRAGYAPDSGPTDVCVADLATLAADGAVSPAGRGGAVRPRRAA
ncbi:GNAT family N-acetyltransferase, cg3035/Rv0428c family, partial [Frankia nepalensis]